MCSRDDQSGEPARQSADDQDKACEAGDPARLQQDVRVDLGLEQVVGVGNNGQRQEDRYGERQEAERRRLEHQSPEQFVARGAQQASGCHLFCPESRLRYRQVDVVEDGEEQDEHAD